MSQIIVILVGLCKGYNRNIIGQILLLFWEQLKNLIKAWKTEVFEQNHFREKLLQCISQSSLKRTFLKSLLTYVTAWDQKCFSTTFVKFFKIAVIESWWIAVSEGITYETKTEWKGSTDRKNMIVFQIKKTRRQKLIFLTVIPILKLVFTKVIKNYKRNVL